MSVIHQLTPEIVAKIAAGEVIERPAYAVKELIENALDAGSTSLKIEIEGAGLKRISISDNGRGMAKDDLLASFLLHTTSKIQGIADLTGVRSFGFRGEALASMAGISSLTIRSREAGSASGYQIEVKDGKLQQFSPVGTPPGTVVILEDLFDSVPVRKKFLRAQTTEARHIIEVVTQLALANPEAGFALAHNQKVLFHLPSGQTLPERMHKLLGASLTANLLPVNHETAYLKISGFVSKPQHSSRSAAQYLFLNKRPISHPAINSAVRSAYGNLLEPHAHPFSLLNLTLAAEMIDVNIHPRKETVHFHNESAVVNAISQSISQVLHQNNLTYQATRQQQTGVVKDASTDSYAADLLKQVVLPPTRLLDTKPGQILQLHNLYLALPITTGLLLIDQHAAHERVLYERFEKAFKQEKQHSVTYELPKTVMFDLPIFEARVLQDNLSIFSQAGFDIDHFGVNTFKVTAIPMLFKDRNIVEIISDGIVDLIEGHMPRDVDQRSHRMLTFLACRSAIKAGDQLAQDQMQELLKDLSACENPYTCPHGRPTQYTIPLTELHKKFKRS